MLRSICLPTKRDFLQSRKSVDSALLYLKNSTNTELLVADNSSDKKKSDYLENHEIKNLKYFKTDGFSQVQNSFICYENASGKFISSMGDDDFIFSNGTFDERNIPEDIVGIRPSFAVWDKTIGIHGFSNFTIMNDDPILRIKEYFVKAKGNNNTLYSFFDKKLYHSISKLFRDYHPFKNGYYDWAIVCFMLANGKVINDNSTIYIYNNERWKDTITIQESIDGLFESNGFTKKLANYILFLNGIDAFVLIRGSLSTRLDKNKKIEVSDFIFKSYLQSFLQFYNSNSNLFTDGEKIAITSLCECNEISDYLKISLLILEAVCPEEIDSYRNFFWESTNIHWG